MTSKPVVVFYPPFSNNGELNDQLARAVWYLSPLQPKKISFFSRSDIQPFSLPDSFSPVVRSLYCELKGREIIKLERDTTDINLARELEQADMVITWCENPLAQASPEVREIIEGRTIKRFEIDKNLRLEGSKFILPSYSRFPKSRYETVKKCEERYASLAKTHANNKKAYLFCSGPSISQYKNYDYRDGISIICNSVINDTELMDWVKPKVLVFADPIFHFGCSTYTYEFYKQLKRVVEKYDLTIVLPLMYYNLFVYHMPEMEPRTIGIPFAGDIPVNLDLNSEFNLRATGNIFTFLMLPVASSLAEEIHILGSDGRPIENDDYFWEHNKKTQFVDQMDDIKVAHPSFFKLDYNEYYLEHCEAVKQYFQCGESAGKQYYSITPSYIPALKERMGRDLVS
ncbi:hypothetical protein [Oceanicoccus sp. KOV_DT_Chl]|uniref:hypothetical protein n=1 Tax=Oceanicoccus sp. KOV_DT_Chl TaxID=1904639 RepID=UPI000C7B0D76|nr:hypothetical protein [Oceanicoccus sp. KOV_DT_Chl]